MSNSWLAYNVSSLFGRLLGAEKFKLAFKKRYGLSPEIRGFSYFTFFVELWQPLDENRGFPG